MISLCRQRSISLLTVALAALPLLFACSDDSASGPGFEGGGGRGGRDSGVPIAPRMDQGGVTTPDQTPPELKESRALRVDGESRRALSYGERLELAVFYIGIVPGMGEQPLANQRISMRMLDRMGNDQTAAGIGGSRLESRQTQTDGQGRGRFFVIAGEEEVSLRVEVSAAEADPVFFDLNVVRPSDGSLAVEVNYDVRANRYGFAELAAAKVSLFEGQVPCETIVGSVNNIRNAYFSWPPLMPFNEVSNTVRADFGHGSVLTALAVLTNVEGNAVAYGCHSGAIVQGGEETLVQIDAVDLPLDFKGSFASLNRFDLSDLLRSSGDETLMIVADVLELVRLVGSNQPGSGAAMIELVCDYLNVDRQFCQILEVVGGGVVEDLIRNNIPPEALQILSLISDVLSIVSEMTIIGEFVFVENYPDPETGVISGTDNRWQRFRFLWRNGCLEPNPADCEREFTIGDLDQLERPIAGTFDSTVEGETLQIGGHGLNFRYGLIALGIAATWLFPALLSSNVPLSLADSLAMVLPCGDINSALGNPNSGFCENVLVTALSAFLVDQLGTLNFDPEQFFIEGYATARDSNGDLAIDQLVDGVWRGTIEIGEDQVLNFNGCFNACRGELCEPPYDTCVIAPFIPEPEE